MPRYTTEYKQRLSEAIDDWVREQTNALSTPESRTRAKIMGRAAVIELQNTVETYERALIDIRDMDYRGNPHPSSTIARLALEKENE